MAELRDWPRVLRRNPPRILLRYWPRNPPRVLLRVPAEDPTEESPRVSVWSRRRPGPVDAATRRCSGSLLQPPLSAPPCFFRCKSSGGFPARVSGILFFRVRDGAAGMRRGGRAERGRGTAGSFKPSRSPSRGVFGAVGAWQLPVVSPQLRALSPAEEIGEMPQKSDRSPAVSPPRLSLLFSRSGIGPEHRERPGGSAGGGCGTSG